MIDPTAPVLPGTKGMLVSLWLPTDVAAALAIGNGEPADKLHLTLAYLGKNLNTDALTRVSQAVQAVCEMFGPVDGVIGGLGRFNASASSDDADVFYASYDGALLPALRQAIVEAIEDFGVPVPSTHGYSPHITLKYLKPDEALPVQRLNAFPLRFDAVTISQGDDVNLMIPLRGARIAKEEPAAIPDSRTFSVEVSDQHVIQLRLLGYQMDEAPEPVMKETEATVKVAVCKADTEKRLVYGIVLRPNDIDRQNQVLKPDDVEFAAHHYMGSQGIMGERHRAVADARAVESYIAPCDFKIGGSQVLAGDWILVSYIRSDSLWEKVKSGEYSGYSVGGFGSLAPI